MVRYSAGVLYPDSFSISTSPAGFCGGRDATEFGESGTRGPRCSPLLAGSAINGVCLVGPRRVSALPSTTCLSAPLSIPPAAMLFVLVVSDALDFGPSSSDVVHAAKAQAVRSAKKSRIKRNPVVVLVSIEGVFPRCRCEIADNSAFRASNCCPILPRYYQRPGSSPVWPRAVARLSWACVGSCSARGGPALTCSRGEFLFMPRAKKFRLNCLENQYND